MSNLKPVALEAAAEITPPETGGRLKAYGLWGTAVWLLLIVGFVFFKGPGGLVEMKFNEAGDFLAGIFAPLAFFWLVLGFFQQGAELRNSGSALWLQGEELRNSVEQQRQLVDVTREQLAFESERLRAATDQAKRLAQPKLELSLGASRAISGDGQYQQFVLRNLGRPCTGVNITFSNGSVDQSVDLLPTAEPFYFDFEIMPAHDQPVEMRIKYLDQQGDAGEVVRLLNWSAKGPIITQP